MIREALIVVANRGIKGLRNVEALEGREGGNVSWHEWILSPACSALACCLLGLLAASEEPSPRPWVLLH